MSDKIGIVTAFFDIGRGEWSPEKGYPHYLQRSVDTYFERFERLAKLENEMVVYTTYDFLERIYRIRGNKPTWVIIMDLEKDKEYIYSRNKISKIQNNEKFKQMIHPSQRMNPEYWNSDYVLINWLKPYFCHKASCLNHFTTDLIAWIDFGYCREDGTTNNLIEWKYDFDRNKIHFWSLDRVPLEINDSQLENIISTNKIHITGPNIVATSAMWKELWLKGLSEIAFRELIESKNLIDDDQTIWTLFASRYPEFCEIHPVINGDWFRIFKDFSK